MDTPEFRAWFGASKVVDANGDPLVVHHGTSAGEFARFEIREGIRSGFLGAQRSVRNHAHFFTPSRDMAWVFGENRCGEGGYGKTPNVVSAWLRIERPLDLTRKTAAVIRTLEVAGMDFRRVFGIKSGFEEVERFEHWSGILEDAERDRMQSPEDPAAQERVEHAREVVGRTRMAAAPFLRHSNLDFKAEDLWTVSECPEVVENLKAMGYDGLIVLERTSQRIFGVGKDGAISYAVFDPHQIKSTLNCGAFDPASPDFRA